MISQHCFRSGNGLVSWGKPLPAWEPVLTPHRTNESMEPQTGWYDAEVSVIPKYLVIGALHQRFCGVDQKLVRVRPGKVKWIHLPGFEFVLSVDYLEMTRNTNVWWMYGRNERTVGQVDSMNTSEVHIMYCSQLDIYRIAYYQCVCVCVRV